MRLCLLWTKSKVVVEGKRGEDANKKGKRAGRGDANVQARLRVRSGDHDESEQVSSRRGIFCAKKAGLKVL